MDERLVITTDQKPSLMALVRRLPAMLAGKVPDYNDIAYGFRARIGYALLQEIGPNFDTLGRGESGADGTVWPPLSPEYLAYGRRFGTGEKSALVRAAGLNPRKNKYAPNDKKGLLTADQLKIWRRTYADRLQWFIMREPDDEAKSHAAAIAWIVVKSLGAKTKIEVFGNRKVQMLVDIGYLRGSLEPGMLLDKGYSADYQKPVGIGGAFQEFDISAAYQIVVGTNVTYAKYHHGNKGNGRRPLWPNSFPDEWWNRILGAAISGLQNIKELYYRV